MDLDFRPELGGEVPDYDCGSTGDQEPKPFAGCAMSGTGGKLAVIAPNDELGCANGRAPAGGNDSPKLFRNGSNLLERPAGRAARAIVPIRPPRGATHQIDARITGLESESGIG